MKAFISQCLDVTIVIKVDVTAYLVFIFSCISFNFRKANSKQLVKIKEAGLKIGFDADGLVFKKQKGDDVFKEAIHQKIAVAKLRTNITQGQVIVVELQD